MGNIIGENSTIKFSSAFKLNDPFELKFNLMLDPFASGQKEMYLKVHPNSINEDFENWQKQVVDNEGFLWYTEQTQRNSFAQAISLSSFTEKNSNTLMWSHYSNNHKGFCVEYSDDLFDFFGSVEEYLAHSKIEYSDFPPSVDSLESESSKIKKIMFNKQSEWKYEQEHRVVIQSKNDIDFIPIDRKYIKAVYIGAKAELDLESKIIELCNANNIDVYHGITLGKTYEVTFKKHKEGTFFSKTFWG